MNHDQELQKAVLDELNWWPSVNAAHIGVTAKAGVVTLTGHVGSYAEKHAAESAARRIKGVKAVAQEITVKLASDFSRSDDEIAEAVINRLSWDVTIPRDAVKVVVENGWITLSGDLDWNYQRDSAEQDVRKLFGVIGVTNQMTVKPRVNASNVSDDIIHALHRSWFFDPKTVTVSAVGGKVSLGGTVESTHDRKVAAQTAWAAPGVTSVENNISVV